MRSFSIGLAICFLALPGIVCAETPKPGFQIESKPLAEALEDLGRQAKQNIIVSGAVKGTVNMRFEDVTPRQAIDVLVHANGLVAVDVDGILYVRTAQERAADLHVLDNPSFPKAMARYKRRYFEALCSEGFSKAEALAIIVADQPPVGQLNVSTPK